MQFAPVAMEDRQLTEGVASTSPSLLEAMPPIAGTHFRQAAYYTSVTLGIHLCLYTTSLYSDVFIPHGVKTYLLTISVLVTCDTPL